MLLSGFSHGRSVGPNCDQILHQTDAEVERRSDGGGGGAGGRDYSCPFTPVQTQI